MRGMIFGMARPNTRIKPSDDETPKNENTPNPVWFKPVMFGFMLLGLAWILVFYISQNSLPIPELKAGNILIGFGIMFIGFLMTTRWR
jgi:thiol:disulfide interchange protein